MTCIAWRAGLMACDSMWTYGDTQVVSLIKIKRLSSGGLLGGAGDNDNRAIEALLDKITDSRKLPSRIQLSATKDSFLGLLALPGKRGGVWMVPTGPVDEMGFPVADSYDARDDYGVWPASSMGGYAAVGSGSDLALAAMDAGATAKIAVEIACRRNINCRPPVHIRRLIPDPKKKVDT